MDLVDDGGALAHQRLPGPAQHGQRLPFRPLDTGESHAGPAGRFADRLGIGKIVLHTLNDGLHILRRNQFDVVSQRLGRVVRAIGATTGVHCHLAGWQLRQKRNEPGAAGRTPQNLVTLGVLRMQMKRPLAKIDSDHCNSFHDGLVKRTSPNNLPGYRGLSG